MLEHENCTAYSSFESSPMMKPEQLYLHKAVPVGRETRPVHGAFLRWPVGARGPAEGRDSPSCAQCSRRCSPTDPGAFAESLADANSGIPHQVISKMTEPVVQCVTLDSEQQENWDLTLDSSPHSLQ